MFVPAITLAEATVLPPPRTYSSTGSALVPDQLSFSPLIPTRQLVAEVKQWKDSYRREKEPLLTHPTITGLQKVHDEWQREQTTQKAMLHVHLAAAVERLEWLEKKCEEQEKEIGDLKGKLDWSERDRDRLALRVALMHQLRDFLTDSLFGGVGAPCCGAFIRLVPIHQPGSRSRSRRKLALVNL
jgi:hypothetical protein